MVEQQTRENPVTRIDPVLRIYWEQKREIAELKAQIIRQKAASDRLKDRIETSRRAINSIIAEIPTY